MYQSIISLGAWCQVAEQLRLHHLPRTLSPLEWTVAPWDAMTAVIRDDGRHLCADVRIEGEDRQPVCQHYGLLYPHDFHPPHGDKSQWFEITPEELAAAQSKYAHKMSEFRRACRQKEGRIAFIRMGGEALPAIPWPYLHDTKALKASKINQLVEDLKAYCGHDDFDLFIFLHEEWHPLDMDAILAPNVRVLERPPVAPPVEWYGHKAIWTELLQTIGLMGQAEGQSPEIDQARTVNEMC